MVWGIIRKFRVKWFCGVPAARPVAACCLLFILLYKVSGGGWMDHKPRPPHYQPYPLPKAPPPACPPFTLTRPPVLTPPSPRNPRHPWGLNLPLGYPPSSSNLLLVCCVVYFLVWRPTICGGENGRTKAHTKTGNEPHFPFFCVYPVDLFWVKLPSIPISLIMKFKSL